jgi:acetoin utilization protein AcuB
MDWHCPQCGTVLPQGTPAWVRQLTVRDVMTANPITLGPEDSLMRALEVMRLNGIRRIPIVVADTLVGLLAEGDLKRAQPSALSDSQEEFNQVMEETQVSRIMINQPVYVSEETPLMDAATTLRETKYGALPVLRGGQLVGIITDTDLIGCLTKLLSQAG